LFFGMALMHALTQAPEGLGGQLTALVERLHAKLEKRLVS
jgi:hypothetical protein